MHLLTIVTAAVSTVFLISSIVSTSGLPIYIPLSGFILAAVCWFSRPISLFLRIFIAMYALGYLLFGGLHFLARFGLLPQLLIDMLPPVFMPSAVVAFALIVFGASFLPVIRTIVTIADPYFHSNDQAEPGPFRWMGSTEGRIGILLVALSIVITFAQVAMQIRLNLWYRDLFDALQNKNAGVFWYQLLGIFVPLATVWISIGIYDVFVDYSLRIRWRRWLTQKTYARWLAGGTHYRMPFTSSGPDNPDQRIQVDVNSFITSTMSLSIRLLSQAATLVSFIVILWGISRDFPVPGTDIKIPGFMVWVVIAYAVIGTWLTHVIGRPLIGLDFKQEQYEANFRFSMARLREYGEQIALLRGEIAEKAKLDRSFSVVFRNFIDILKRQMKLVTFTGSYDQASVVFPYILAAPSYFANQITLGQFQQVASAFNRVQGALSFFISAYTTLAAYKAVIDRLTTFNDSMTRAEIMGREKDEFEHPSVASNDLRLAHLDLLLPDGRRVARADDLSIKAGERTLLTGPSGSGKSTLFRAIAGIWPFGRGRIETPKDKSIMLLPQRPYIPQGTLRAAIAYPSDEHAYSNDAIRDALTKVKLTHLSKELDREDQWQQRLSGGEQQRLAIARALLAKPDWLFLDEATASLDEPLEADIYAAIRTALPQTTIVSIGHRSTLAEMHDRQLAMTPSDDGVFTPRAKEKADA